MIHQYKSNGFNIVMDVDSGAVHVVDDVTYDVISLYENKSADEIVEDLKGKYDADQIRESLDEVNELKENNQLFTVDKYEPIIDDFKKYHKPVRWSSCREPSPCCSKEYKRAGSSASRQPLPQSWR